MLCVSLSPDPWSALLWGMFAIVDFPVSLLYLLSPVYTPFYHSLGTSIWTWPLYLPHVIHIFVGSIWWYFAPRLVTPKRLGGLWGKKP